MYIFSSAVKNIRRYAGRYALFGILLFLVLAIGTITHIASYTAEYEVNQLIQKYGATVIVTKNLSTPYPEDLTQIADFPQVQEMQTPRFFFKIIPSSVNIDGVPLNKDNIPSKNRFKLYSKGVDLYTDLVNCSLRIEGIDFSIDPQINLLSASNFIKEGRLPTENNEVSLDVEFCTLIGIPVKMGSALTISFGESEYTYTVVGFHSEIYGQSFNGDSAWCPVIMSFAPSDTFKQNGTLDAYYQNFQPIIEESYKAVGNPPPESTRLATNIKHNSY